MTKHIKLNVLILKILEFNIHFEFDFNIDPMHSQCYLLYNLRKFTAAKEDNEDSNEH